MKKFFSLAILLITIFSFNSLCAQTNQDKEFMKFFRSYVNEVGNVDLKGDEVTVGTKIANLFDKYYDRNYFLDNTTSSETTIENNEEYLMESLMLYSLVSGIINVSKDELLTLEFDKEKKTESSDGITLFRVFKATDEIAAEDNAYKDSYIQYMTDFSSGGAVGKAYAIYFKKLNGEFKVIKVDYREEETNDAKKDGSEE